MDVYRIENAAIRTLARAGLRIGTAAEFLRHRHTCGVYCQRCRRWVNLDLEALVARGLGDRLLRDVPLRCRDCGTRGELQVRPPVQPWAGYGRN